MGDLERPRPTPGHEPGELERPGACGAGERLPPAAPAPARGRPSMRGRDAWKVLHPRKELY